MKGEIKSEGKMKGKRGKAKEIEEKGYEESEEKVRGK